VEARRPSTGTISAAKVGKVFLLLLPLLLLAWWIVKISVVNASSGSSAIGMLTTLPDHPRVNLARATAALDLTSGSVPDESRSLAKSALTFMPLANEPFLLEGASRVEALSDSEAKTLLEESRRRRPRDRATRLLLLNRYLRENDLANAGTELAVLRRLAPDLATAIIPALTTVARSPGAAVSLATALRSDPELLEAILIELITDGTNQDLIIKMAAAGSSGSGLLERPHWRRALLESLVERGNVQRAHQLWRGFQAGDQERAANVFDGQFQGLPGLPPFNWIFSSGEAGVAEPVQGPALEVDYFGRANAELARQLLMLGPGRYRLQFIAEGSTRGEPGSLAWEVRCNQNSVELARIPLRELSAAPKTLAGEFAVPTAGCAGQWLRLVGTPGEFATSETARISSLQVISVGAR
jgi:hypothetical protein